MVKTAQMETAGGNEAETPPPIVMAGGGVTAGNVGLVVQSAGVKEVSATTSMLDYATHTIYHAGPHSCSS
jgi:copper homeostasis protein CutC